jgi:hypothetical protein
VKLLPDLSANDLDRGGGVGGGGRGVANGLSGRVCCSLFFRHFILFSDFKLFIFIFLDNKLKFKYLKIKCIYIF